jgi:hypothetical protein
MKRQFNIIILALVCVMMFTSCGGGGKKLASNEFLGDMPNLVLQKAVKDSIRDAKKHAERDAFKEKNMGSKDKSVWEKAKEMEEKFDAERKAADEQFNAEVEKLKPSLVGKVLPVEVENGCGYEVSNLKISDLSTAVKVEFEVKITDESAVTVRNWGTVNFYFQALDKDGNLIGKAYYGEVRNTSITMSQKNGTIGKGSFYLVNEHDAEEMVNFAKIKFVKSK